MSMRLIGMKRLSLIAASLLILAACDSTTEPSEPEDAQTERSTENTAGQPESAGDAADTEQDATDTSANDGAAAGSGIGCADGFAPARLTPEAEKGEKGARNILLTWGRMIEEKRYGCAYAQFGDEAAAGMDLAAFERFFDDYRTITVGLGEGRVEGAAGSLYYRVPITISGARELGGPGTRNGEVTLRRVNDVPGASAEQLRWHISDWDVR